jgi:hypothetical protein
MENLVMFGWIAAWLIGVPMALLAIVSWLGIVILILDKPTKNVVIYPRAFVWPTIAAICIAYIVAFW